MANGLLDTSAVLAFVLGEPHDVDEDQVLAGAAICSTSLTELIAVLTLREIPPEIIKATIEDFGLRVLPFTETAAEIAGTLLPEARHLGMTLADCASIATAIEKGLVVWTANPRWTQLRADGATIEPIRKS
ncbi:PIN domain-containing protein [Sphingomonas sp. SKA58]|jgi:PIN domain nuclease of toxin-antitoxin system|uniref:PIN domain-containing protein n=1 Tax=Sphingomonas sp. (strain SKA58) TaxID=314266 RepID=UPI000563B29E|nr:PIN domain-containing protein [Sphingomonas sp. SKA58]